MVEILVPPLGADLAEATLRVWVARPGARVHADDVLAVLDVRSSSVEVRSLHDGLVGPLLAEPGSRVRVGGVLTTVTPDRGTPGQASRVRATPYARRLAAETGIPLDSVVPADGTTVHAGDVAALIGASSSRQVPAATAGPGDEDAPLSLTHHVDLTAALAWMEGRNRALPRDRRLHPAALVPHAVARAAAQTPALNGLWTDGGFTPSVDVHLGVVVTLRGGATVTAPVPYADRLSVAQMTARLDDLLLRARAGRLRPDEPPLPTIVVVDLGDDGPDKMSRVLRGPQVALVGIGRIAGPAQPHEPAPGVPALTTLTLSMHPCAADELDGDRFLALVDDHLQHPGRR